jgi:AmmeMemoRadiSam system protein A
MHPYVELARDAIAAFVKEQKVVEPPAELVGEAGEPAGVFVSLHDEQGRLRGCVGTVQPTRPTVPEEIVRSAINSATEDPRFPPVRPDELEGLEIHVDVLTPMEPIEGVEQLDPRRYGVMVESTFRRGLLLPDLPGVDTVEEQVAIACRKAGIEPDEEMQLYRFEVNRYT